MTRGERLKALRERRKRALEILEIALASQQYDAVSGFQDLVAELEEEITQVKRGAA